MMQSRMMKDCSEQCARELLETAPLLVQFIRDQVRGGRAAGPSLQQFRALAFVSRMQNSSLSAAAEHLGLSLPATSRLIDGLVAKRFVERRTVSTNRRQVALALTLRGQATLESVRNAIRRQLVESLRLLPDTEQQTVLQGMKLLRGIFSESHACGRSSPDTGKR